MKTVSVTTPLNVIVTSVQIIGAKVHVTYGIKGESLNVGPAQVVLARRNDAIDKACNELIEVIENHLCEALGQPVTVVAEQAPRGLTSRQGD